MRSQVCRVKDKFIKINILQLRRENILMTKNEKATLKFLAFFAVVTFCIVLLIMALNPSQQKVLEGQWQLTSEEENNFVRMINDDFPVENIYFYDNGQMTMNGENCTYSISEGEMIITSFYGGTTYYDYILTDSSLTLTRTNGPYAGTSAYYEKVYM